MPIITLTTDLGIKDFYLAAIKGSILSNLPDARIVDITHQIPSYNIAQAAFIIKNSYHYFPEGTVHLIMVDNCYQPDSKLLAVYSDGHYFIGPDNGLFSLALNKEPDTIVKINLRLQSDQVHFPMRDILSRSAIHLAKGSKMELIGRKITHFNYRTVIQPILAPDLIRGSVIYLDSFHNVITNITREIFESVGKGRAFNILFKRGETIEEISNTYSDVPEGEKLALFGITGNLEIAINKGKAGTLLGLNLGEIVTIEFK
jgi:S-adenosyl-L-methionine hydrolase (adenosine-forming)